MAWEVLLTDEVEAWVDGLPEEDQLALVAALDVLEERAQHWDDLSSTRFSGRVTPT